MLAVKASKEKKTYVGQLHLEFHHKNGATRMKRAYQDAPLKASQVIYTGSVDWATVYMMESSGGMVAGDRNEYKIKLADRAKANLLQQSATKIYESIHDRKTYQTIDIDLGEHSHLFWHPETTIPYKNADFQSKTRIYLKETSSVCFGEIIAPGREQRGECFDYDRVNFNLQVWKGDQCIVYDALNIAGEDVKDPKIGLFGKHSYLGSLWFITPYINDFSLKELNEMLIKNAVHDAAVTGIEGNGLHIRWLSSDVCLLKEEMKKVTDVFQDYLMKKD